MSQLKNISKDTGIDIKQQKIVIEGDMFKKHRKNINILLRNAGQAIDDGKQDMVTITSKITIGVIRCLDVNSDNYGNIVAPLLEMEENMVLKLEDKRKDKVQCGDYELITTDDGIAFVDKNGLQSKMDLEGIEGKQA